MGLHGPRHSVMTSQTPAARSGYMNLSDQRRRSMHPERPVSGCDVALVWRPGRHPDAPGFGGAVTRQYPLLKGVEQSFEPVLRHGSNTRS